jgi:predicted amidophosphoribosyltransferase
MRPCPNCQQPVEEVKTLCPNCGAAMGVSQAPTWPPPIPNACPHCHGEVPPGATVCLHCGLRFAPVQNRGPSAWAVAGTTCGVTALIIGIVGVVIVVIIVVVALGALKACSKL